MRPVKKATLSFRASCDVKRKLNKIAKEQDRSLTNVMEVLIKKEYELLFPSQTKEDVEICQD